MICEYVLTGGKVRKGLTACIPLVLYLFWPAQAWASSLSFNGEISHQYSDGDDVTVLSQTTSLDLNQDLTTLMRLTETIRYSSTLRDGATTETITPTVDFNISNDIFRFSLTGIASKRMDSERTDQTNKSWESRLASNWQKVFWPRLRVSYGQDFSSDDQSPSRLDSETDRANLNLDWDLLLAELYYTMDYTETENEVDNSKTFSTDQLARLSTGASLFDHHLDINLVQQYSWNDQEFRTTIGEEGFALFPVAFVEVRAGWPVDLAGDPDYAEEPDWEELDQGFPEPVVGERYNIALQMNNDPVDTVYILTASDLSDDAHLFQWDLYTSDDGMIWRLMESSVSSTYNRDRHRFELEFSRQSARYLMLVENDYPFLDPFTITGIATLRRESGIEGEELVEELDRANYLSNTSVRWQIAEQLAFTYNFTFEQTSNDNRSDIKQLNHNSSLRWKPWSVMHSTVSVSDSRETPEDDNETRARSYALSLTYTPLSTLNINLGLTRSENYREGEQIASSNSYQLYTTAEIYPDLTSSLDLIYTTAEQQELDRSTRSYNARWKITARLVPDLTVDFAETYTYSESDSTTNESIGSGVNVSWRPSAMFSLNVGADKFWRDEGSSPFRYDLTMNFAPTEKTQFNLGYSHSRDSDEYRGNWNWTINNIFSFTANLGYIERMGESRFSYGSRLTVRY